MHLHVNVHTTCTKNCFITHHISIVCFSLPFASSVQVHLEQWLHSIWALGTRTRYKLQIKGFITQLCFRVCDHKGTRQSNQLDGPLLARGTAWMTNDGDNLGTSNPRTRMNR
jgi:hypothetical protein